MALKRQSPKIRRRRWERLPDEELLKLRLCDLRLKIRGTALEAHLQRLYGELERRGIRFRPHVWLSEEWFSPDGIPGIAIPFYLAHPRLARLEREFAGEVEGGNSKWLMRILRHEAGHALDSAYRVRRRRRWREVFGPASLPYPNCYRARPGSRRYVHHLGGWYAQAHPTEDFAETFAVWLTPKSAWRRNYADWPAQRKLKFVEGLMTEIGPAKPLVKNRARVDPLDACTRTLAQYYRRRLAGRRRMRRGAADELLAKVFTHQPRRARTPTAASLLRRVKPAFVVGVAREQGVDRYSVEQMLRMAIDRSEALGLYVRGSRRDSLRNVRWMLARLMRLYQNIESPQLSL